ncbi:hypothetical protein MtrunA17_Chr8g0372151 [Medicago truncatula]|uniref:Uncharacterized protein n=1 Tax=Medicago truncatula TaxID=3880 RepID=A0A396GT98_MEDTR|nr:hypothetical protein MtrunA17_Chr8g0372151 [Medicago truncatula]
MMATTMERPFEFIGDITDKKDFWKLPVKVKDKWTVVKDGKEHLELVIVDKKVWTGGTTAIDVNHHDISNVGLKFKSFAEIITGKWRADLLVHVIGVVSDMGYCQFNEENGKKLQDYAAKFINFNNDRKEGEPIIVLLKYGKIKEECFLPKDGQLMSQSTLVCTQSQSSSQIPTEDELLKSINNCLHIGFKIEVEVSYEFSKAGFVLWDREVT